MRDDSGVETRSVGVEDAGGLEGSKGAETGVTPEDALEGPDIDDAGGRYVSGDIGES